MSSKRTKGLTSVATESRVNLSQSVSSQAHLESPKLIITDPRHPLLVSLADCVYFSNQITVTIKIGVGYRGHFHHGS
uniref:Uncharacterized protein n=1 Tax=Tetranychus urticae TaxID=32264 RepID=T1KQS3_TETUR